MTKQELKQILLNKKGYYNNGRLRKGKLWICNHFNISGNLLEEVLKDLKTNKNGKINLIQKPTSVKMSNYTSSTIRDYVSSSNTITKPGTYYITGCSHAPFHNKAMYDATFNYLVKETKLDGIILAGDFIDANSLSFHDRGNIPIPGVTLDWEYKESNKFLNEIDDMLYSNNSYDKLSKYYLYGNHEDRYKRILRTSDASKYGEALISPEEGLKLSKRGYNLFTDWKNDVIHIGKHLDVNHGEFFNVHCAKKTIDTYRKSTLFHHTHRFQIFMEGMNAGFNLGWGGDINAPVFGYASRAMKNSWVNCSSVVTLDNEGFYHVQPLLYIKNKLIINGKEY